MGLITIVSCSNGSTKNKVDHSRQLNDPEIDASELMIQKKFKEPDNTAVFTTKFVTTDKKEITEVHHDEDEGDWQFFSDDHFKDYRQVVKVVGLGQIIKLDTTLLEIADMPVGYLAHRKFRGDRWVIEKQK